MLKYLFRFISFGFIIHFELLYFSGFDSFSETELEDLIRPKMNIKKPDLTMLSNNLPDTGHSTLSVAKTKFSIVEAIAVRGTFTLTTPRFALRTIRWKLGP